MSTTIYRRMQQKYDTEANWSLYPNFVPLQGEIVVYAPDVNHQELRFKIGNGNTPILELPFVSGDADNIPNDYINSLCI